MIIDDTVRSLLCEVLAVHGSGADDNKGTGEWHTRAMRLEEAITRTLLAPAAITGGKPPMACYSIAKALQACRDYLDGIPESAAGGDNEARRLVRMADRALNAPIAPRAEKAVDTGRNSR